VGHCLKIETSSTATNTAGFYTSFNATTRLRNPSLTCTFILSDVMGAPNDYTFFIGFTTWDDASFTGWNGTDPLNDLSGIGLTVKDDLIKIACNYGFGYPTTFFDFPEPILFSDVSRRVISTTISGFNENDGWRVNVTRHSEFMETIASNSSPAFLSPAQDLGTLVVNSSVPDEQVALAVKFAIYNTVGGSAWDITLNRFDGLF
jgi:hypothetical protein